MGKCVVPSCNMHTDRDSTSGVRFFPIPAMRRTGPPAYRRRSEVRRRAWLILINNDDLKDEYEKTTRRICSRHFVSGQPSVPNDERNPDWLPSIDVGYIEPNLSLDKAATKDVNEESNIAQSMLGTQEQPAENADSARTVTTIKEETFDAIVKEEHFFPVIKVEPPEAHVDTSDQDLFKHAMETEENNRLDDDMVTVRCDDFRAMEEELTALRNENAELKKSFTKLRNQLTEVEVDKLELNAEVTSLKNELEERVVKQTVMETAFEEETMFLKGKLEECENRISELQEEERSNAGKIAFLKTNVEKMKKSSITQDMLLDMDFVNFYTGLPNYGAFESALNHVGLRVTDNRCILASWQCFLLTLMRLRLSLTLQDLGYRFGVSKSTACQIFEKWLYYLYEFFEPFIVWPDRATIKRTTPENFKNTFSDEVVIILHCFELASENSKAVDSKSVTQNNAKKRNSVKYFIGITPSGTISLVTRGWEGIGDDACELVEEGFYEKLMPGDEIMADHGLSDGDPVGWYRAKLLKSDKSGEIKLRSRNITDPRKLALVRSHIDKITSMRRRYRILRGELPLQDMHKKSDHEISQIDQIVRVCCALSNIAESHL